MASTGTRTGSTSANASSSEATIISGSRMGSANSKPSSRSSPASNARPLEAFTATRRLTCDAVDLDQLTTFTDRHFTQPLGYKPHPDRSN